MDMCRVSCTASHGQLHRPHREREARCADTLPAIITMRASGLVPTHCYLVVLVCAAVNSPRCPVQGQYVAQTPRDGPDLVSVGAQSSSLRPEGTARNTRVAPPTGPRGAHAKWVLTLRLSGSRYGPMKSCGTPVSHASVFAPVICCATSEPTAGASLKPWPLKPLHAQRPATRVSPIIGWTSSWLTVYMDEKPTISPSRGRLGSRWKRQLR
mmetsp:Transcript_17427/g.56067  ORF Transcript_17427/g.56067 Transcript_17427/m.56067 type:complete len:211 (-) Transcript_17427:454-1086(-)